MSLNCVDISNYSGPLTTTQANGLKAAGVELAIVQAIDPLPPYPPGCTRQQIEKLLEAGIVVDAYVYLWFDLGLGDIQRKLGLLNGLQVRRLWLDVEDLAARKYDFATCEAKVHDALLACDEQPVTGSDATGVYTGRWFWADAQYMGNSTSCSSRALWDSNYDDNADASANFRPYGGWTSCAIKQFKGTSTLAGVPNVDLNALSDEELAKVVHPVPPGDPCADLVNALAYVCDDLGDQLLAETRRPRMRKDVIRGVVQEMQRVRTQMIGPRP